MSSHAELRLVVLGRTGAGKRSAVCAILGLDSEQDADGPGPQESRKHRGQAAGRQVAVVSGPPWFGSGCDPQQRRRHLSALVALSSPGPHAFLLCVPVNRPADEEAEALAVLGRLFGASAVSKHTVVLFTHTEELEEDEQLDDYLAAWRHDLQELLQRCGGRHHTLEARAGAPGARAPGAGAPGAGAPGRGGGGAAGEGGAGAAGERGAAPPLPAVPADGAAGEREAGGAGEGQSGGRRHGGAPGAAPGGGPGRGGEERGRPGPGRGRHLPLRRRGPRGRALARPPPVGAADGVDAVAAHAGEEGVAAGGAGGPVCGGALWGGGGGHGGLRGH
ncbi:uncharacterized PE-PGRS family protein PE_PGRS46 isoform X1 [Betta splendens]|uniref:Uncharacterized PE-PGRS family protein PE_PGRS46 isoform X1 n=1 Tax=Betta splendens TaxID=158456 RepID=A0A9W2XYM5_BETSP|nr:uncharacterized PE-PGRS family protein PE_PGRS46 isoform X1 [Betta splendens]